MKVVNLVLKILVSVVVICFVGQIERCAKVNVINYAFENNFGFSIDGLTDKQRRQFQKDVDSVLSATLATCTEKTAPQERANCLRVLNERAQSAKDAGFTVPPPAE